MKRFFTLAGVLLVATSMGQKGPVLKTYAFEQQTIAGMRRTNDSVLKPQLSYLIYLELPVKVEVALKYIWINQICKRVEVAEIAKTPVIESGNAGAENGSNRKSSELVPATSNRVMQVMPGTTADGRQPSAGQKLSKTYSLVIAYVVNGKWYYAVAKEIGKLRKRYGN